ncbi:22311_t:CDS:2 [Rhizophagus irregularis]|nr:22311_t:CDS:2 [Rhizophagus irregularis]
MKRRKAQNAERTPYNIAAILQLGLIVFDFVMDILFASKKAPEILYFRSVLYYDVISLLTLASSSLTLTVHIIGRFYQTIRPSRPKSTSGHPLQIHKREIQSSDQGKESSKGKLPEVVVDTQKADDNKELLKNRSSISSFKEVLP